MGQPFVGMQVGAISFVDEGVEPVLESLASRGRVNALLLSAVSWSRGNTGRATTGFPDHGVSEPDALEGGSFFKTDPRYYAQSPIRHFPAPEPYYDGFDMLRDVVPAAKARGARVRSAPLGLGDLRLPVRLLLPREALVRGASRVDQALRRVAHR